MVLTLIKNVIKLTGISLGAVFLTIPLLLHAQQEENDLDSIAAYVLMDSVVVKAVAKGLDIKDFVQIMQTDESLYRAFKKLRQISYKGIYQMRFYDKYGLAESGLLADGIQSCNDTCCELEIVNSWDFGRFFKSNGKHRYYTGALFHELFLDKKLFCRTETDTSLPAIADEPSAHKRYLKMLIFRPGVGIDIPMVGHKTAIFSKAHFPKYAFSLEQRSQDSVGYYVFKAVLKEEYASDLPIQYLETWFTESDRQITERHFHIVEDTWVYDVDVLIDIELRPIGTDYYPSRIRYRGRWDIPGNPPENGDFLIQIDPMHEKVRK